MVEEEGGGGGEREWWGGSGSAGLSLLFMCGSSGHLSLFVHAGIGPSRSLSSVFILCLLVVHGHLAGCLWLWVSSH